MDPRDAVEVQRARVLGRSARARMSPEQRRTASQVIAGALAGLPEAEAARSVAGYWPAADEVDLRTCWEDMHRRGVSVHLPRVDPTGSPSMHLVPWDPRVPMRPNRFGIPEPGGEPVEPTDLDVIVLPCVALDDTGARVGMGKGFYDRVLEGPRSDTLLVGVAFDAQRIRSPRRIGTRSWDVVVDVVITEVAVRRIAF